MTNYSWKQIVPTLLLCLLVGLAIGWLSRSLSSASLDRQRATSKVSSGSLEVKEAASDKEISHTVRAGETLSAIGATYGISWEAIASYNNVPSPYQVKEGLNLKIPAKASLEQAVAKARSESEVTLPIDSGRLQEAQKEVVLGRLLWRLDPIEVIKRDSPSRYGFGDTSIYFLKSKDTVSGNATVEVERAGTKFSVVLIQPVDKGVQGVWAIEKIRGKP